MTTPGMLELADEIEKARNAYLDAIGRGPGGEVEKRVLKELLWDNKGTFAPALRQAAAPQGREALELADDLISELANKFYSIDPYTRAGTTEGARHDLAAIDKVKAKIRAALSHNGTRKET